jgi:hypothetical protein
MLNVTVLNIVYDKSGLFNCYTECPSVERLIVDYRYAMCHFR